MARIVPDSAILIPENAQCVFKGEIFDVYQWPQHLFDGSLATFEMLRRPDTVLFIAIKDDKIVLIREKQPGREERLRVPGGRVDAGEEWLDAVKRECSEEIGMSFATWKLIEVRQPVAKIEWFVATYVATDLVDTYEPHIDAGEQIHIVEYTLQELKTYLRTANDPVLGHLQELFGQINSLDELLALPEFRGRHIS